MESSENQLLVRKIEEGTVIDHLPAWSAQLALKVLRVDSLSRSSSNVSVIILQNVASKSLGRKDLVKIDRWHVEENEADILCLIFPSATINYVSQWKASKYVPRVPDTIEGRIRCPELLCISHAEREPLTTKFNTLKKARMLQCRYCDTLLPFDKIPDHVQAQA